LKAVVYLIEHKEKKLTIKEIAKAQNISESFLRRVIADLDRAKIIKSYK
jgi:DNA-binding IscR family transcriptional regulator